MPDVTMQVIEAQEARSRMQEAKKRIKAEVRRKYEARITQEVAERSQEAEYDFARTLARVHASGVSQAILRRDVLRTNVWGVWTYWRDLAEIEPERVTVSNAKAERTRANAAVLISDDKLTLTLQKDSHGKPLPTPVEFDLTTLRKIQGRWWPESGTTDQHGISDAERAAKKQDPAILRFLHEEIQRAIDEGTLDDPTGGE